MKPWMRLVVLVCAGLIPAVGTYWAFQRGGRDFDVFFYSWTLVREGQGHLIYVQSPDRFLYAPGFAWLLSPLAALSRNEALAIWCLMKTAALGGVIRAFSGRGVSYVLPCLAVLILGKYFLIDFQYGQVNVFILFAVVFALFSRYEPKSLRGVSQLWVVFSWAFLSIWAVGKIFPLVLLGVPFFAKKGVDCRRLDLERLGMVLGVILILAIPLVNLNFASFVDLYRSWWMALQAKGVPLDSHNQSFIAFIHHYFSGNPIEVISIYDWVHLGWKVLDDRQIRYVGFAWSLLSGGFLLAWLMLSAGKQAFRWMAVLVGLLVVPGYLIWKPYLILGFPAVLITMMDACGEDTVKRRIRRIALMFAFVLINFSGFDWIGHQAAAWLETASLFFWVHLVMLFLAAREPQKSREAFSFCRRLCRKRPSPLGRLG